MTQGPLHSTRDDFWRMCWESNSRAIVMLTRCIEKGREKCDHYWPFDTRPSYYGDISVTILNDSHYQDWSITEFMLCRVRPPLYFNIKYRMVCLMYFFNDREKRKELLGISISQRGLISVYRILHRR